VVPVSTDPNKVVADTNPINQGEAGLQYVWLIWSSAFLLPWLLLYALFPNYRRVMLWSSALTMPFGLTEPLFVPEYWNPPSLFDLAQTTGFDIESLIFCFAIGGVGAVMYNALTGQNLQPVSVEERRSRQHRYHYQLLFLPFAVFPALYFLPWNPIYPGIFAMIAGGMGAVWCRPDLKLKTLIGGSLFLGYYLVFMLGLKWSMPGYIEQVWNLNALSGIVIYDIPLEELLFGFSIGLYWTGVYEHLTWQKSTVEDFHHT
jgi:hypothetical protein